MGGTRFFPEVYLTICSPYKRSRAINPGTAIMSGLRRAGVMRGFRLVLCVERAPLIAKGTEVEMGLTLCKRLKRRLA